MPSETTEVTEKRGRGRPPGSGKKPPPQEIPTSCIECARVLARDNKTGRCASCTWHMREAEDEVFELWVSTYRERIASETGSSRERGRLAEEFVFDAALILVSDHTLSLLGDPVWKIKALAGIAEERTVIDGAWKRLEARGEVRRIGKDEWEVGLVPPKRGEG